MSIASATSIVRSLGISLPIKSKWTYLVFTSRIFQRFPLNRTRKSLVWSASKTQPKSDKRDVKKGVCENGRGFVSLASCV